MRERIPDSVVDEADEVEVVDMSAHALRQRMRHGNVYPKERAEQALHSFFREGNLNALRELVLRKVATTVEEDLEDYMRQHDIEEAWAAGDRVLACIDASPESRRILRRASQLAARLQADCIALFVETPGWAGASPSERSALEEHLLYAQDVGAEIVRVQGRNVATEIIQVAKDKNVGSVVVGPPARRGLSRLLGTSTTDRLLQHPRDFDVHVVASSRP